MVMVAHFYRELVMESAPEEVRGCFSILLASLLSALLALSVSLRLFNEQTYMIEKQRKERLNEILEPEIGDIGSPAPTRSGVRR